MERMYGFEVRHYEDGKWSDWELDESLTVTEVKNKRAALAELDDADLHKYQAKGWRGDEWVDYDKTEIRVVRVDDKASRDVEGEMILQFEREHASIEDSIEKLEGAALDSSCTAFDDFSNAINGLYNTPQNKDAIGKLIFNHLKGYQAGCLGIDDLYMSDPFQYTPLDDDILKEMAEDFCDNLDEGVVGENGRPVFGDDREKSEDDNEQASILEILSKHAKINEEYSFTECVDELNRYFKHLEHDC